MEETINVTLDKEAWRVITNEAIHSNEMYITDASIELRDDICELCSWFMTSPTAILTGETVLAKSVKGGIKAVLEYVDKNKHKIIVYEVGVVKDYDGPLAVLRYADLPMRNRNDVIGGCFG